MKEDKLNYKIRNFLYAPDKLIISEVPFLSRTIDIVALENNKIYTIELKIKNWKKAIEQMLDHSIASNYCYLCMPKAGKTPKLISRIIENLSLYGFGLYLWDDQKQEINEILTARESIFRNQQATINLINNLKILKECRN